MIGNSRRLIIENLVSPYGLALASYSLFLVAWVFPPDLYTSYVHEPDRMFLDPLSLIFYTCCVATFLLGVRATRFLGIVNRKAPVFLIKPRSPFFYTAIPLFISTTACVIYLFLLGGNLNFMSLLNSQQGDQIKLAAQAGQLNVGGRWSASPEVLTAVLWWGYFRTNQVAPKGFTKFVYISLLVTGFLVVVFTSVATVGRALLMPLIVSFFVFYVYRRTLIRDIKLRKFAYSLVGACISILALFSLLQYLRGSLAVNLIVQAQIGYSIASYNRLASLLSGTMGYQFGGRGVYLAPYLLGDNLLNRVFDLSRVFGWPDLLQLWQSETPSVAMAGLNPSFIWSGVFGYLYSDLGWYSLIYMFLTGIVSGYLWWKFRAGTAIGIVMYAWFAWWIIFWEGWNLLLNGNGVVTLETAIVLAIYDAFAAQRVRVSREESTETYPDGTLRQRFING